MNFARWLRILGYLEREYDDDELTLRTRIDQAKAYVDARTFRADLVAELPPSAPPGYLLVTAGDPNLYVGTGMGSPLRRIPTLAV